MLVHVAASSLTQTGSDNGTSMIGVTDRKLCDWSYITCFLAMWRGGWCELLLTVAVELSKLVQVGAQFSRKMSGRFIQEAQCRDGPATG